MTMQQDPSGPSVTVVGPGDPTFSDPNAPTQSNAGGQWSQPSPSAPVQQDPAQNQPPAAAAGVVSAPPVVAPTISPELEAVIQARVAAAHSGLDRKVNTLTKQLQDKEAEIERAQEENQKAVRAAQVVGLSDEDKKRYEALWADEDRVAAIEKREKAVGQLYLNVEGLRLLTKYEDQGIVEDDILGYTGAPSELETFVKGLAFDRLTDPNAGKPAAGATGAKVPPAGSAAPVDLGNTPSVNVEPKLLTTQGLDSMASNIKTLFADDKPVVPWA